ncbi:tRNA dihydrouridine(16) synthase DusC [Pseudomonas luteola]|uniref:tRNA dihydrouridine synthase n=1 Tax=Pseudomonas luteola TaxID=47886 RepID=UPI00388D16B8
MQIALAPMEGLVDEILRDLLTQVGGIDWCVTEFIRITNRLLPLATYEKYAPELASGSMTRAGVPMRVQFLGSDPVCLAENAAYACTLGAPVIDLNFGCPAKTVNNSKGGAILLNEPELLHSIVSHVRRAVPSSIPVTAKMRLGYDSPEGALECAQALVSGGAQQLVVHARTKKDGYKPPAHWEWIARVAEVVDVPVLANGEIWTLEDYWRCREVCGIAEVMLGRGLVSRPDLARQIAASVKGEHVEPMQWEELFALLQIFWLKARQKMASRYAPGRFKQWLGMLSRNYEEALTLFGEIRRETECERIDTLLGLQPSIPSVA